MVNVRKSCSLISDYSFVLACSAICLLLHICNRCASSSLNGEELVRDGGITLLATLLSRCMYVVQNNTPGTDPAAMIVTNVVRTFACLSKFRSAWREMLQCPGFVEDIVHCSELEDAPVAVDSALQTISNLALSQDLQDRMLKAGVIW